VRKLKKLRDTAEHAAGHEFSILRTPAEQQTSGAVKIFTDLYNVYCS
jgi:hypothetical protein